MIRIQRAHQRGETKTEHWQMLHTFAFNEFHHPKFVTFGQLRVLNEIRLAPQQEIPFHNHENIEIITYVHSGELVLAEYRGKEQRLPAGSIHVLSAGKGMIHAERNPNPQQETHYVQWWIFPQTKNLEPETQGLFDIWSEFTRKIGILACNDPNHNQLLLHQDAAFLLGRLNQGQKQQFVIEGGKRFVLFVFSGKIKLGALTLDAGETLMASRESMCAIQVLADDTVLFGCEIP